MEVFVDAVGLRIARFGTGMFDAVHVKVKLESCVSRLPQHSVFLSARIVADNFGVFSVLIVGGACLCLFESVRSEAPNALWSPEAQPLAG